MRKIIFLIFIIVASFSASAQESKKQRQQERRAHKDNLIKEEEEGVIAYKKSFVFGAKLISDGYGIFFELGRASSVKKSLLYQLEISERKNVKEDKESGDVFDNSIPFIYGKENFFYQAKLGVQQQILLGNKSNKNGVSITGSYGGGLSLALLRPYYVQVDDGSSVKFVKYNSPDSAAFLNIGDIAGGPTFGKGWSEIAVTPGLYAKTSLRFDYGSYNEIVSAIEVGITAELYSKKIPILVHIPQRQFFFSGYVAICFGKRK